MRIHENPRSVVVELKCIRPRSNLGVCEIFYSTAEAVFQSVCRVTHADWLLDGPRSYDIGPTQYDFYFGPVSFGGKVFKLILMKVNEN